MEKPLLEIVGEVANIAQLTGLHIPKIAGLIITAAISPRILKRRVLKFGQHVEDIMDLLNALDLKAMMENGRTRNFLHRLAEGLEKSRILVNKCNKHGYFYLFLKGLALSQDLKQAQEDIDECLKVIPVIVLVELQRLLRLLQEQNKNAREEEECKKKRAAIYIFNFKQLLDEAAGDITNKTDYKYFAKKWGHDERFKNLDHIQRISLFIERKGKTRQATHIASSKAMPGNSNSERPKGNPSNVHLLVGELLDDSVGQPHDDGALEYSIEYLIMSAGDSLPVEQLIEECEKRNRLRLLKPILEHLVSEGSQDVHVHNALSKVIIDTNDNPEDFLSENPYYDSYVVGKYCEKTDPTLAVIAYRRAKCDGKLIDVTNKNKLFELQARYVVERKNLQLWKKVLALENPFRRKLIYQVVSSALPENKNSYQISATVTAFINVDQPHELIEFLEKIVLRNSKFSGNPNLQCLLIRTAIVADRARLMTYINRFDNFNGSEIGRIAVRKKLYEEAFHIFKKFNLNVQAVDVLLDHIRSFERAVEFASCVKENAVWSRLANAQLKQGLLNDAIESFISADDATQFDNVIRVEEESSLDCDLVKYLLMVKKKVKGTRVLTTLNAKLASAFVKLRQFQKAFQAAQNVNRLKTWKEICFACVDAEEFKLAKRCGLKIFVKKGGLEEVSGYYQKCGRFYELISLMEEGLRLEHSPKSLQTELHILYAKYCPDKLK